MPNEPLILPRPTTPLAPEIPTETPDSPLPLDPPEPGVKPGPKA